MTAPSMAGSIVRDRAWFLRERQAWEEAHQSGKTEQTLQEWLLEAMRVQEYEAMERDYYDTRADVLGDVQGHGGALPFDEIPTFEEEEIH